MESCSLCGTTTDRKPHVTCANCGKTVCELCYENHKNACPNCGYARY